MSGKTLTIPTALVLDTRLTARMIRLWLVLQASAKFKDDEGNLVNVRDRRDIATEMKASYISISGAIETLQKFGWVRIERIPDCHGRKVTIFESPQMLTSPTKANEAGKFEENQVPAEI
jgi:hypothetical protein